MKRLSLVAAAATATLLMSAPAKADTQGWFDGSAGTAVTMPAVNAFGGGPQSFSGITWTSTNSSTQGGSVFGYTGTYGFDADGEWSGTAMAGLNDSTDISSATDTMTFTFDKAVSAFGGEINWVTSQATVWIGAYDASNNLLEGLLLSSGGANINTPDAFYGFISDTADIKSFTLTDGFIGIRNLREIPGPAGVPEPASWALLILGFAGLGAALRTRRQALSAA
jgi:hypothetical protein